MEWFTLLLEYLKVFLTTQVMVLIGGIVFFKMFQDDIKALMLRIAKIRLPGGGEVSTPQLEKQKKEKNLKDSPLPDPDVNNQEIPETLESNELKTIKSLLDAEKARAYFWEYRYLNYYLVNNTQRVLNWFASVENKASIMLFDTIWLPLIPDASERKAIISALENHHLIQIEGELVTITPKGREYIEWRGPLPETS